MAVSTVTRARSCVASPTTAAGVFARWIRAATSSWSGSCPIRPASKAAAGGVTRPGVWVDAGLPRRISQHRSRRRSWRRAVRSVANPTMAATGNALPISVAACAWCGSCPMRVASRAAPGASIAPACGSTRAAVPSSRSAIAATMAGPGPVRRQRSLRTGLRLHRPHRALRIERWPHQSLQCRHPGWRATAAAVVRHALPAGFQLGLGSLRHLGEWRLPCRVRDLVARRQRRPIAGFRLH